MLLRDRLAVIICISIGGKYIVFESRIQAQFIECLRLFNIISAVNLRKHWALLHSLAISLIGARNALCLVTEPHQLLGLIFLLNQLFLSVNIIVSTLLLSFENSFIGWRRDTLGLGLSISLGGGKTTTICGAHAILELPEDASGSARPRMQIRLDIFGWIGNSPHILVLLIHLREIIF